VTPLPVRRPRRSNRTAPPPRWRRPAGDRRTPAWPGVLADLRSSRLHRAGRRALRTRVAAVTLAACAGLLTHAQWTHGRRLEDEWGPQRAVLVATRDLQAGDALDTGSLRVADLPTVAVPVRAVDRVEPGRRAVRSVGTGEVLVHEDLAPAASGPLAARLPAGHTGVSVVLADGAPAIGRGDLVDVVAAPEPFGDIAPLPSPAEALVVARSALVLDVVEDSVTLAVADAEATQLAQRALLGPVGLVVRRPVAGP